MKVPTVLTILLDFARWSSVACIRFICYSETRFERIFWITASIVLGIAFAISVALSVIRYLGYPSHMTTTIEFDKQEFPTITICNSNAYKMAVINKDPSFRAISQLIQTYRAIQRGNNITNDTYGLDAISPRERQLVAKDMVMLLAANMAEEEKLPAMNGFDDLVTECTLGGKLCSMSWFSIHMDAEFGACLLFQPNTSILRPGIKYGLRMLLTVKQQDPFTMANDFMPTVETASVRIAIHDRKYPPEIARQIPVAVGKQSSILIEKEMKIRAGSPYTRCVDGQGTDSNYYTGKHYTQQGCMNSCRQRLIIKRCGCADPRIPRGGNSAELCRTLDDLKCIRLLMRQQTSPKSAEEAAQVACSCPRACIEEVYMPTLTTAEYPSAKYTVGTGTQEQYEVLVEKQQPYWTPSTKAPPTTQTTKKSDTTATITSSVETITSSSIDSHTDSETVSGTPPTTSPVDGSSAATTHGTTVGTATPSTIKPSATDGTPAATPKGDTPCDNFYFIKQLYENCYPGLCKETNGQVNFLGTWMQSCNISSFPSCKEGGARRKRADGKALGKSKHTTLPVDITNVPTPPFQMATTLPSLLSSLITEASELVSSLDPANTETTELTSQQESQTSQSSSLLPGQTETTVIPLIVEQNQTVEPWSEDASVCLGQQCLDLLSNYYLDQFCIDDNGTLTFGDAKWTRTKSCHTEHFWDCDAPGNGPEVQVNISRRKRSDSSPARDLLETSGTAGLGSCEPWNINFASVQDCITWYKKNALIVNIYFGTLATKVYKETPSYTISDVISELGGQAGVWLGLSAITLVEISTFILVFGLFIFHRFKRLFASRQTGPEEAPGLEGASTKRGPFHSQLAPPSKLMPRSMEIDERERRYPYCVVWTPIPLITWLFPFVGHMGIATSKGVIRDFAGSYYVSEDEMGFGWPTRVWQLSPEKVEGGDEVYDRAIRSASDEYKGHMHNIFCDNCHSHVALAMNEMKYDGREDWNMVNLATAILFKGRALRWGCILRQWLPAIIFFVIIMSFVVVPSLIRWA